jgi:hypothetical protein
MKVMVGVSRPEEVTALAILFGISPIIFAFLMVFMAVYYGATRLDTAVAAFFTWLVITEPVGLALVYGLWKGKKWAFYLCRFIAAFGILGAALSFYDAIFISKFNFMAHGHQLLTIPLSVVCIFVCPITIYYLRKSHVRTFFIKPSK